MSFLSPLSALDLGSTTTRYWLESSKTVRTAQTPQGLIVSGRITDDEKMGSFLHTLFFGKDQKSFGVARPRVVMAVPGCFTSVEQRAFVRAATSAGALGTELVSISLCAASGAGVDLMSSHAVVLLSCGSEFSELAVLVSGTQVESHELTCTARSLCERLTTRVQRDLHVAIAPNIFGSLLETHFSLTSEEKKDLHIPGKNMTTGKASEVVIPWKLVAEEAERFLEEQAGAIEHELNHLSATLSSDILEQGILLYGGFAQLPGLSLFLASRLKIPVSVVPESDVCVINGLKDIASSISFTEFDLESDQNQVLGC